MGKLNTDNNNKQLVKELSLKIKEKGGQAFFVGGYVRDYLLGISSKYYDIKFITFLKRTLKVY